MKTKKALKRLTKIEALVSDLTERFSASAPHIRAALQTAKAAVTQAKDAVSLQASSGTVRHLPVRHSKPTSQTTAESQKPKRKLSATGRKASAAATKKRWAPFHAAKKAPTPLAPKKAIRRVRKKATFKKAVVKAAKKTVTQATTKGVVKNSTSKKSAPAKTSKAPANQAVVKSVPVGSQLTAAVESAPTPEVVAQ